MKILITGVNGFIGRTLAAHLLERGHEVHGIVRKLDPTLHAGLVQICAPNLGEGNFSLAPFEGFDACIHMAAIVHQNNGSSEFYQKINVDLTLNLAKQSITFGIKKFVFMSSIKAYADTSRSALTPTTPSMAQSPYGLSKYQAEEKLKVLCEKSQMQLVILRPPVVYGPGGKGNFARIMHMASFSPFMFLPRIQNRRDFLYVGNLVSAIETVLEKPGPAIGCYFLRDAAVISTTDFIKSILDAKGCFYVVFKLPRFVERLFSSDFQERFFKSLYTLDPRFEEVYGWTPPYEIAEAMRLFIK